MMASGWMGSDMGGALIEQVVSTNWGPTYKTSIHHYPYHMYSITGPLFLETPMLDLQSSSCRSTCFLVAGKASSLTTLTRHHTTMAAGRHRCDSLDGSVCTYWLAARFFTARDYMKRLLLALVTHELVVLSSQ